jgi:drug/metabolite transporter (DMT)-like permease
MQHAPPSLQPHPFLLWPLVAVGITAISFASILIRLADAPFLAIAAYRVALASLILIPYYLLKPPVTPLKLGRRLIGATCLSGCFLAFHFTFWIRSLQMTSIASSTSLVSTTPFFVALFAHFCFGERLSRNACIGILLVIAGSGFLAGTDYRLSMQALVGDLLALAGALAASGYLLAGRFVRRHLDLTSYTLGTYGTAALILLGLTRLSGTPLIGYSGRTYLVFILLAVIPQLIGHTTFNWTLKFLSPTTVAVLILGEPIGATLLAYFFFDEGLPFFKALGLVVLGSGMVLSATASPGSSKDKVPLKSTKPMRRS